MNSFPVPQIITGYIAFNSDKSFFGKFNKLSELRAAAIQANKMPDQLQVMQILGSGKESMKKSIFLSDYAYRVKIDKNVNGLILEDYEWSWTPPEGTLTDTGIEFALPKKHSVFNYYLYKISFWFANLFKFL
jgi:hypothetical protein